MAVKIRLKRLGKIRAPYYRIVVADSRTKRDGRAIEEIGKYHPTEEPSVIEVDSERALYWLGVGAQPSEQVMVLLKITGDWQKFKGLPGTEGTLRVKEVGVSKKETFEAASKESLDEPTKDATTPKKKAAKKSEAKADDAKAGDTKADDAKKSDAKADDAKKPDAKADDAKADAKADDAKADAKADDAKADAKADDAPVDEAKAEKADAANEG